MTDKTSRNTDEILACLIIDDPLIRPRYGCLDYAMLLRHMREHDFFTEIAFIPWNYRRSNPRTVRLFADNPDRLAICVHGCNHTKNEFGKGSYEELSSLAATALWRMEQHQRITGLPFDPVFVFPQGCFSSIAVRALKEQGYSAAFNSTLRATDMAAEPIHERRSAACLDYHGFPILLRQYPKNRTQIAEDAASGRPILIVEHHDTFRNGYKEITDFIDWINRLGNVRWCSLSEISKQYTDYSPGGYGAIPHSMGPFKESKVALRRYLSEARDNSIGRSGTLSALYKRIRR